MPNDLDAAIDALLVAVLKEARDFLFAEAEQRSECLPTDDGDIYAYAIHPGEIIVRIDAALAAYHAKREERE